MILWNRSILHWNNEIGHALIFEEISKSFDDKQEQLNSIRRDLRGKKMQFLSIFQHWWYLKSCASRQHNHLLPNSTHFYSLSNPTLLLGSLFLPCLTSPLLKHMDNSDLNTFHQMKIFPVRRTCSLFSFLFVFLHISQILCNFRFISTGIYFCNSTFTILKYSRFKKFLVLNSFFHSFIFLVCPLNVSGLSWLSDDVNCQSWRNLQLKALVSRLSCPESGFPCGNHFFYGIHRIERNHNGKGNSISWQILVRH